MVESIRVLHVEDEADFAEVTAKYLTRADDRITVETVHAAPEALDRIDEIDCVVSDFEMPTLNGLEFLASVRKKDPSLPFILFTGKGSEEVAAEAISAGVTDYLQKGGSETFELLANRIAHAVEQYEHARRFEALVDTLPGIVYRTYNDANWTEEFLRGEVIELTGYAPEDILRGDPVWADLIHPADRQMVWNEVQDSLERDGRFEFTYRITTREGDTKWVWERGRQVDITADGVEILEGFITDITERRARELALEAERTRLTNIFETVPEPAVHVVFEQADPIVIHVNEAFEETFGYDATAVTGRSLDELIVPPAGVADATDINEIVLEEGYHQAELVRQTTDGYKPFLFTAKTIDFGDGHLEGVGTYVDLTEQSQREAALTRQNERLEQFASLLSHDLRNPLNIATGRIELAMQEVDNEHLESARVALDRMEAMIQRLLDVARESTTKRDHVEVDLSTAVIECWQGVSDEWATLENEATNTVLADAPRLKQIFENLLRNAVEHGDEGVTITVGDLEDGFFVEDDGPGIPAPDRNRVFEPGESDADHGTGFGLAIVREIATDHSWQVTLTEGETGGARFEFTDVDLI